MLGRPVYRIDLVFQNYSIFASLANNRHHIEKNSVWWKCGTTHVQFGVKFTSNTEIDTNHTTSINLMIITYVDLLVRSGQISLRLWAK